MHGQVKVKTSEQLQKERREKTLQKIKLYNDATDAALALVKTNVMEQKGLEASKKVLEMNTEFYSLWNYRRSILDHWAKEKTPEEMEAHYKDEMNVTAELIRVNPKSYWLWHHRKWAGAKLGHEKWNWEFELKLCSQLLSLDHRNFHCWSYRRYVCQMGRFTIASEFEYTTTKIEENFSNYSAWHQRSKLIPMMGEKKYYGDKEGEINSEKTIQKIKELIVEELELVWKAMYTLPEDQSPWIYHQKIPKSDDYDPQETLQKELENTFELLQEESRSKWPLLASVILMQELNVEGKYKDNIVKNINLLQEVDPDHVEYYKHLLAKTI